MRPAGSNLAAEQLVARTERQRVEGMLDDDGADRIVGAVVALVCEPVV